MKFSLLFSIRTFLITASIVSLGIFTCFVSMGYAGESITNEKLNKMNWRPRLDRGGWLPFRMSFPENFLILPFDPKEDIGLDSGFFCGPQATIKDLWKQKAKNRLKNLVPQTGFFFISWSDTLQQTDANTFSISDEEIRSTCKQQKVKSVKIVNHHWDQFPVKSIEMENSRGPHKFVAYVGLNTGGEVIKIQYFCPKKTSFALESDFWNQFLYNSKGIPIEEFLKLKDKEFELMFDEDDDDLDDSIDSKEKA